MPTLTIFLLPPPEGELITLADTNDLAYAKQMTRYLKIVVFGESSTAVQTQIFVHILKNLSNLCMPMWSGGGGGGGSWTS